MNASGAQSDKVRMENGMFGGGASYKVFVTAAT